MTSILVAHQSQDVFTVVCDSYAGLVRGTAGRSRDDFITLCMRSEFFWKYMWDRRDRLSANADTVREGIAYIMSMFTREIRRRYVVALSL